VTKQPEQLNLNDQQKTKLFSLALDADERAASTSGDEERGDLLCDILRCPLPAQDLEFGACPRTMRRSHSTLSLVYGPPMRDLLDSPETDVSILRRIKEYAKALGSRAELDVEEDVFFAIYFAAIAAARVFHGERITDHTDEDLAGFLADFALAGWMRANLAVLFKKAAACCREGSANSHGPVE
jgi:hypothetical protein